MELVQFKKCVFGKNELTIDDSITLDEWKELGQSLKQVEGSVQFWIGDWARYGEKRGFTGKYVSPKVYDELEEITGYSRQTIQDAKYVSEKTSSLRNEDVSYNHHKVVAPLEPEEQEYFLTKASEEKLSVRELREEVKKSKQESVMTLQRINDQLDWEKELKEVAKNINMTYTKEQRQFLVNQIKL